MAIKVIVTGATGMVGEGVLLECLQNPQVSEVLIINRKPSGRAHAKLREIIHKDFYNIAPIKEELNGYDACFFCLGVTSIGKSEAEYSRLTYDLTMHVATILAQQNPQMTFCYVSGAGTDSTAKGKSMWARVKGKTENDLMKLPFKDVYAFRPGIMKPTSGQRNVLKTYWLFGWLYPILRTVSNKLASTIQEVARTMIYVSVHGYEKKHIEVPDIITLSKR